MSSPVSCWMVRKQRGPGAARGAPRGEGTAEALCLHPPEEVSASCSSSSAPQKETSKKRPQRNSFCSFNPVHSTQSHLNQASAEP